MRTIERNIVSAVLISCDGRIFQALQDPDGGGVYPGHWGLIGGGMEEGEDQRTTLNREVFEETGIDISSYPADLIDEATGEAPKTLKETGERVHCKMHFYTYRVVIADRDSKDIDVVLDDEHTEGRWSMPEEMKGMKITPPSVELFKKLGYL